MQVLGAMVAAAIAASASTALELAATPQAHWSEFNPAEANDAVALIARDVLDRRRRRAAEILQAAAPIATLTVTNLPKR